MTPDFDFDDEDYPSVIALQLRRAHFHVEGALERERVMLADASARVEAAKAQEQAQWQEFEGYLLEALRWREKQTGSSRLVCAHGTFRLQDVPEAVALDDEAQVQEWARSLLADLALLCARLSSSSITTSQDNDEIVTDFYRRMGLLPAGCHLLPNRRVPFWSERTATTSTLFIHLQETS